jgi:monoterpene epsilon-lactone hydrolase
MFSVWLYVIVLHIIMFILFAPFIDVNFSPLGRYSRMTVYHRIFSARCAILSFLNIVPVEIDSHSKAFDEVIRLYYPQPVVKDDYTINDIEMIRYHSKKMLAGLLPPRPRSCHIESLLFVHAQNLINISVINDNQIDDWRTSNRPFVLYFHGGGFVFGDIDIYSGFECHLSKQLNMTILHVNLGFVPEYSLVQITNDIILAYELLGYINPHIYQRLIGMGDSSGGILWIYLLQWLVSNNKNLPQGVVLHSPWFDLEFYDINCMLNVNSYISVELAESLKHIRIGTGSNRIERTNEEKEKIISKLDSFESFPPLFITAGTNEIFIDNIRKKIESIKLAGVDVTYEEGEGLMHSYALFHLWLPKARLVQEKIRQWIQQRLLMNVPHQHEIQDLNIEAFVDIK